jgi:HEPN domain-containing protein
MAADPVRAGNTRAWLEKAEKDLRRVELLLAVSAPDTEDAVFHAQQAAEKALKGFLTWHDCPFKKTHDLDALGAQCRGIDPSLEDVTGQADRLTEYAWLHRYPAEIGEPSLVDAQEALGLARALVEAVAARLSGQIEEVE